MSLFHLRISIGSLSASIGQPPPLAHYLQLTCYSCENRSAGQEKEGLSLVFTLSRAHSQSPCPVRCFSARSIKTTLRRRQLSPSKLSDAKHPRVAFSKAIAMNINLVRQIHPSWNLEKDNPVLSFHMNFQPCASPRDQRRQPFPEPHILPLSGRISPPYLFIANTFPLKLPTGVGEEGAMILRREKPRQNLLHRLHFY